MELKRAKALCSDLNHCSETGNLLKTNLYSNQCMLSTHIDSREVVLTLKLARQSEAID